ncbi:kelch-like protein 10 [Trichonephila clavipes]|nr:kelch-like protein 10 [Trichonephila clavipes]
MWKERLVSSAGFPPSTNKKRTASTLSSSVQIGNGVAMGNDLLHSNDYWGRRVTRCINVADYPSFRTEYILDHFLEIAEKSIEYLDLSLFDLKCMLKEDSLNVQRELLIWKSLKRWINHDARKRQHYVHGLLKYMRLAVMPIKDFQELINDPIVFKSVQCWPYISQVAKFILKDLKHFLQPNESLKENLLFMPRLPRQILICLGGWSQDGPTSLFETYDCRGNSWKQIEMEDSIGHRVYHQSIALGKSVYIVGGSDGFSALSSCFRFDTETKKYEEMSPMHEHRGCKNPGSASLVSNRSCATARGCFSVPPTEAWEQISKLLCTLSHKIACAELLYRSQFIQQSLLRLKDDLILSDFRVVLDLPERWSLCTDW